MQTEMENGNKQWTERKQMVSIICPEYKVNEQIVEVKFGWPREPISQPSQKSRANSEALAFFFLFRLRCVRFHHFRIIILLIHSAWNISHSYLYSNYFSIYFPRRIVRRNNNNKNLKYAVYYSIRIHFCANLTFIFLSFSVSFFFSACDSTLGHTLCAARTERYGIQIHSGNAANKICQTQKQSTCLHYNFIGVGNISSNRFTNRTRIK